MSKRADNCCCSRRSFDSSGIRPLAKSERGQGTVEAAFMIPILMVGMLILLQPGILLYDRIVMQAAASEACRLLATSTDELGDMEESCEEFVRHRLSAVPQVSIFHVHDDECSWVISFEGDEDSQTVRVSISNEVEPLPLIGSGAKLLGLLDSSDNFVIEVTCEQETQPSWVASSDVGMDASEWAGAWLS